jgi:hypothetical protein
VQTLLQQTWPATGQHAPLQQFLPLAQTIPHPPQLKLSVFRFLQLPLQQVKPEAQAMPQPPQLP